MKQICKHCGTTFAATAKEAVFCCAGCAQVYERIREAGLETFYAMRDEAGRPVDAAAVDRAAFAWAAALQATSEAQGCRCQLRLDGLSCLGCAWLVEHLFKRQQGAEQARVSLEGRSLWMQWQPRAFDLAAFLAELRSFGYSAAPFREGVTARWSPLTWRWVLCGIFALNGLLLSTRQVTTSLDPSLHGLFRLLELCFAILSLLVGGSHFIVPAWRSLQARLLHYDLLVALGVVLLTGWQLRAFFHADAEGAGLWPLSALLTVLLFGRWCQSRASLGEASPSARGLEPQQVQRWLQYYLRAVLCGLPLGIVLHLDSPVSRGLESILAACFAGALYPLARAAQSRPSQAVFACGLMTAATGVGLSLFGWLSSFQAIVWMALSGLLWQGLRSASRPTAPVE